MKYRKLDFFLATACLAFGLALYNGPRARSETTRPAIRSAAVLSRPIASITLDGVSLTDAFNRIADASHTSIVVSVDPRPFKTSLHLKMFNTSLGQVLNAVIESLHSDPYEILSYRVREGVIYIEGEEGLWTDEIDVNWLLNWVIKSNPAPLSSDFTTSVPDSRPIEWRASEYVRVMIESLIYKKTYGEKPMIGRSLVAILNNVAIVTATIPQIDRLRSELAQLRTCSDPKSMAFVGQMQPTTMPVDHTAVRALRMINLRPLIADLGGQPADSARQGDAEEWIMRFLKNAVIGPESPHLFFIGGILVCATQEQETEEIRNALANLHRVLRNKDLATIPEAPPPASATNWPAPGMQLGYIDLTPLLTEIYKLPPKERRWKQEYEIESFIRNSVRPTQWDGSASQIYTIGQGLFIVQTPEIINESREAVARLRQAVIYSRELSTGSGK